MTGELARTALDLDRLRPWLAASLPEATPPFAAGQLPGGRSNLTFLLSDAAGRRWVLRRPPLGTRQQSAHDVLREARIVAALAATAVPVPAVISTAEPACPDGAPLVLMEHVEGMAVRGAEAARTLAPAARARAGAALAEALAALHAVAPEAVGLGDLGRGSGYLERQLRRWRRQWEEERTRPLPDLEETYELLAARVPRQERVAIVHGDFRLENCLLDPAGEVAAVLDWEICTLGDPLADLALLLVYWAEPGDAATALEDPATRVPGFATRAQLRSRYEEASAAAIPSLDFHLAFAWWKLACIVEGVYGRGARGALGSLDRPPESFARQAERLAAAARAAAARLP